MSSRRNSTPQLAGALALSEFAARWDKQLLTFATKVDCQCNPVRAGVDESDHDPDCPVGLFRQAGRLMSEEASEAFEAAKS